MLTGDAAVPAELWPAALALWFALVYAFFGILTAGPAKPPLAAGLDGSWLLVAVAAEAVAILGTHAANALLGPTSCSMPACPCFCSAASST